jgi:hypothetical protein
MERGSIRRERLALEHPDKWSPHADKFLQSTASSSAKELLSVSYFESLIRACSDISARFLEEFTTK